MTIASHVDLDPLLVASRMQEAVDLYLNSADPHASPVLADYPNPPPVLIQVGENKILLCDCNRLEELTDGALDVWPHVPLVPHVWQIFDPRLPEARFAMRKAVAFLQTSFDSARR